jgi:hypothetical protein
MENKDFEETREASDHSYSDYSENAKKIPENRFKVRGIDKSKLT